MATPSRLSSLDQAEQLAHVGLLQRLGRLVEEQHLGPGGERARDLDDVALGERQLGDAPVDRHAQFVGRDRARSGAVGRRGAARSGERRRRELKVFQHGQVRRQRRMLIHRPRRRPRASAADRARSTYLPS